MKPVPRWIGRSVWEGESIPCSESVATVAPTKERVVTEHAGRDLLGLSRVSFILSDYLLKGITYHATKAATSSVSRIGKRVTSTFTAGTLDGYGLLVHRFVHLLRASFRSRFATSALHFATLRLHQAVTGLSPVAVEHDQHTDTDTIPKVSP
jgi:hypothetical protein